MKIVFIGSSIRIKFIKSIVNSLFTNIEPLYIIDNEVGYSEETAHGLMALKGKVDAAIFGGEVHYDYYSNLFSPDIPCDYVAKDWSSFQSALLKLSLMGIDFLKISVDSYSKSAVIKLYGDLKTSRNLKKIKIIERKTFNHAYMDYVYNAHVAAYRNNEVKGCMTALLPVYNRLRDDDIPCVYVQPTTEVVTKTINQVMEDYKHRQSYSRDIAIIEIKILPKLEYSYMRKDEYLYMHEKLKVADEIFYFARNTNAAIVSESVDRFIVLMNKSDLMNYTHGLQHFYLINSIYNNTNCDVNIGIGYGYNPLQAKYNASIAIEKFDPTSKNLTYIVPDDNAVIGPLNFLIHEESDPAGRLVEDHFEKIAESTGISQMMLYKLYTLMEREKKTSFTLSQLAKKLETSQRNASRLMQKLEIQGLAEVVGKEVTGKTGRPSAIFEINIQKNL